MRSLHDKVNIVPVIAKADTLTKSEIRSLKARVSTFLQFLLLRHSKDSRCFLHMFYGFKLSSHVSMSNLKSFDSRK